ncbi:hypothetical protein M514_02316 [Trichuris suis]|uniref:Uncharacterized protein n=1 Tax=Trichuris suis TaxID=68888 RepID=A0A085MHE4_9BILA|nr:hypothetical protein M513_02316 [Trichuris suis]KFD66815.1 hypothetical protein M514_02316 [Trichuris suis]
MAEIPFQAERLSKFGSTKELKQRKSTEGYRRFTRRKRQVSRKNFGSWSSGWEENPPMTRRGQSTSSGGLRRGLRVC